LLWGEREREKKKSAVRLRHTLGFTALWFSSVPAEQVHWALRSWATLAVTKCDVAHIDTWNEETSLIINQQMHYIKFHIKTPKIAPTCFDPKIILRELRCPLLKSF
jgi:hypothetical protein